MNNIYVSSIAFKNLTIKEIINECIINNFSLEFSSGINYDDDDDIIKIYNEASILKMPHNYFPAPKIPFVLNLASSNNEIREKSIIHCKNCLEIAVKSNSPFYAAHAGFCIDPKPSELGNQINYESTFNIENHKTIFFESLDIIINYAQKLDMLFLIENNVIIKKNIINNKNPLLCCDSNQINELFNIFNNKNFGLLLDTGHLKVSANTLKQDLEKEYHKIEKFIKGIHHSDNDGVNDSNNIISENYWFKKFLYKHNNIPIVLEVKDLSINEIKNQINILNND